MSREAGLSRHRLARTGRVFQWLMSPHAVWNALRHRLETTAAGVELGILRGFVALRLVNTAQMTLAVATLGTRSPRPAFDVALAALFLLETYVLVVGALRRGTLRHTPSVWADTVLGCLIVAAQPLIAPPGHLINTWDAWGYAVTLSCGLLVGITLPRRQAFAAVLLLSAAYLGAAQVGAELGQLVTAGTNAVAYASFALVGWSIASYLRRLGVDADDSRKRAELAGRELEREQARSVFHDQAALLATVGRGGLDEPALRKALTREAKKGAMRVNAYMATGAGSIDLEDGETTCDLRDLARHAGWLRSDLNVTVNADLAAGVILDPATARVVASALNTLLLNVRAHANAQHTTIHADGDPSGACWEVTVRDDGVGFDPATVGTGYGLGRQVRQPAAEAGIDVTITSSPGNGTAVTLRWPQQQPTPAAPAARADSPDS